MCARKSRASASARKFCWATKNLRIAPHLECDATPEKPLGAPMVSTEGACAAYINIAIISSPNESVSRRSTRDGYGDSLLPVAFVRRANVSCWATEAEES